MKPQMVAKRNAELRRKAREAACESVDIPMRDDFPTGRDEHARELAAVYSQGAGGVAMMLFGIGIIVVCAFFIRLLLAVFLAAWFLGLIMAVFMAGLCGTGAFLIRGGVALLKGAAHRRGTPLLRGLQRLSLDAVPVVGYVVGIGKVTNQVLICFDETPDERRFMTRLAEQLSDPETLDAIVDGEPFVPDRRFRLPLEMTDGRIIYVADLQVKHVVAAGKVRSRIAVPCMADPGGTGRIAIAE